TQAGRIGAGIILPSNPTLQVEARPGLNDGTEGELGYSAILSALFEVGGAPGARVREAEERSVVAQTEAMLSRLDAKVAVTEAYVANQLARDQLDYATEARDIAEHMVSVAHERSNAGAGSDVELTTAGAELAERRAEMHAAAASEALAQMSLRLLADLPVSGTLRLVSAIDDIPPAPASEVMAERARTERPDLALVEARLSRLRATETRLSRELYPKVGAYLGVDAAPSSPWFGQIGVQIELPFVQRNQQARAVLAEQRDSEGEVAAVLLKRIDLELTHRRLAHEEARAELAVLVGEGIPVAQRRLQLVEEGWRSGRFDVFRVTKAAEDLVRLKALRLSVLQRIWRERLALERLVGGFFDAKT
ncbi:MAG: TolC family protein, partial [Clostridia bacterium]|nr:TolC family protein [Deltaproteobacteria bacterium]